MITRLTSGQCNALELSCWRAESAVLGRRRRTRRTTIFKPRGQGGGETKEEEEEILGKLQLLVVKVFCFYRCARTNNLIDEFNFINVLGQIAS